MPLICSWLLESIIKCIIEGVNENGNLVSWYCSHNTLLHFLCNSRVPVNPRESVKILLVNRLQFYSSSCKQSSVKILLLLRLCEKRNGHRSYTGQYILYGTSCVLVITTGHLTTQSASLSTEANSAGKTILSPHEYTNCLPQLDDCDFFLFSPHHDNLHSRGLPSFHPSQHTERSQQSIAVEVFPGGSCCLCLGGFHCCDVTRHIQSFLCFKRKIIPN